MQEPHSILSHLKQCANLKLISDLDYQFARFIAEKSPDVSTKVLLAAALLSNQTGQGHLCIELKKFAGQPLFGSDRHPETETLLAPKRSVWRSALRGCKQVALPGDHGLMVLDAADRLYLAKYWHFEAATAAALNQHASQVVEANLSLLKAGLQRLFPDSPASIDWQKIAAAIAVLKPFSVITGGPGTGKTTTVVKLLALLVEQQEATPPRIALAAPTGKAAARLSESIREKKSQLLCSDTVREAITDEATTLHRLLGVIPGKVSFRHNRDNPLHLDVLVIDEASMIDLPMMSRLLDALPLHCRLILLGDKDQLASVEAGSVLGDICAAGLRDGYSVAICEQLQALTGNHLVALKELDSPLNDAIVWLRKSYRFDGAGGIGMLAMAVNAGKAKKALASFDDLFNDNIKLESVTAEQLPHRLAQQGVAYYRHYLHCDNPADALQAFNRFRILCALREGVFGVQQLNQRLEKALNQQRLIDNRQRFYAGRPVMITRNDAALKLYNGDIGLIWPDSDNGGRLRAFFMMADGSLRKILPNRLPQHETTYVMTVHKSQGSEFEQIILLLPDEALPVITRELLYTGITRAKKRVEIWSHPSIFERAINRPTARASGLTEALRY
ncbi:MAG: exodeoxyribonuclease V subunit alpha [Gammaproteobacteria bacterium]|nr:exodeoxyribonuclease V subunit alpha [Gammaproteobacteria bacterium]MCF6230073.1 exodeoxyribonuclease V subunit alpha [Gammaproteobacteria bacterium]